MRTVSSIFSAISQSVQTSPTIFKRVVGGRPVVTSWHRRQAVDLSSIMNRAAAGLDNLVRASLTTEDCESDTSVGTVGWTIQQNGLRYAMQIKDENNNDVYNFGVEVPYGQPYLHRLQRMCVAEKAHVLALIRQTIKSSNPNAHDMLLRTFNELEIAACNPATGVVTTGPVESRRLMKMTVHPGLSFPEDSNCTDLPDPAIMAIEWDVRGDHNLIDCSGTWPVFLVGSSGVNGTHMQMTKDEAANAIKHAKTLANADSDLQRLAGISGLWARLEIAAERHGLKRMPAPTYP